MNSILIVDPFASGYPLVTASKRMGYKCTCLVTVPDTVLYGKDRELFEPFSIEMREDNKSCNTIVRCFPEDSIEDVVDRLVMTGENFSAIIAGSEPGVDWADAIASRFSLPHNDLALVRARRDKACMKSRAQEHGLRVPAFRPCNSLEEIVFFAEQTGLPIILKPPSGGATVNVIKCETFQQASEAYSLISQSEDCWGHVSDRVIAEEYIGGVEYQVNLFADGNTIYVTDVWLTEKVDSTFASNLYYRDRLQLESSLILDAIHAYAIKCTSAVGVKLGPAHCEIKVDNNGPALIEIASRFGGGLMPQLLGEFSNFDPYEAIIDVFVRGQTTIPNNIEFRENLCIVSCPILESGSLDTTSPNDLLPLIKSLPSYYTHHANNDAVLPTTDLRNYPMFVWLANEDPQVIAVDAEAIHELFGVNGLA